MLTSSSRVRVGASVRLNAINTPRAYIISFRLSDSVIEYSELQRVDYSQEEDRVVHVVLVIDDSGCCPDVSDVIGPFENRASADEWAKNRTQLCDELCVMEIRPGVEWDYENDL